MVSVLALTEEVCTSYIEVPLLKTTRVVLLDLDADCSDACLRINRHRRRRSAHPLFPLSMSDRVVNSPHNVPGWAVIWRRGFVSYFLRVPLACLGIRTAAVQPWNSRKIVYKTSLSK